ncbi:hypothetical protein DCAR_0311536 [Daucus carota subsp. sativus]|uniref:Uncharacterized protein n=1 Tax=Daucus carota subsp. sativus TaxID=79200 RepID=A0A166ALI7_DAUCS|nr:PREDICTED: protein NRDE2 homolog isoform X2 [Daucus carota subsp. sativus]WOG92273.1 hypothetical protein DCAR_0311536 [Daucus carota subsp. sativus]
MEDKPSSSSLFPVFTAPPPPTTTTTTTKQPPQWLSNTSFTTDISLINDAVSSHYATTTSLPIEHDDDDLESDEDNKHNQRPQYELVDSPASDYSSSEENKNLKKKKRKRKKQQSGVADADYKYGPSGRKSDKAWANSSSDKDYFFDSRGDRDNLAFGCIYRMDVARYKPHSSTFGNASHAKYHRNPKRRDFDADDDIDVLDSKLKSVGRYWSARYNAVERHKNFKRMRITAPEKCAMTFDNFIPLSDDTFCERSDGRTISKASVIEESWEDVVLRKTREFNKLTREYPHNEKGWLDFADFQDKVASMQPQKGARLQTLEKKVSILEKAVEVNPDNEDLLVCLLNAYRRRDSTDVLISRWEKLLVQHSGSWKLWKEFLQVVQGEFSRFKIPEMRRIYANAIRALSATRGKQHRQAYGGTIALSHDSAVIQQELNLVDLFVNLCRFEWQAGYQELATALFQAEIEYCLFCPSLLLSEQSKLRLFEYFWDSNGSRVGEDGALGWSTWLEKTEEQKQKVVNEESDEIDEGGWTGWSEPLLKTKEVDVNQEKIDENIAEVEESDELGEGEVEPEKDAATLLKMLGIDADADASDEVKNAATWIRWSQEEILRDTDQWMPLHPKTAGDTHGDGITDGEIDEHFSRVILFEDISDYMFSLTSEEARLSLLYQFIDFYGGKISQWTSTNSSAWGEKILSLEVLPDIILDKLRRVHEVLTKAKSTPMSLSLECLLDGSGDTSMRTNMMKFLRNATLLCLSAFPKNHLLQEAVLVADELSNTRMGTLSSSVTPCRALAKTLLKKNRQDVLLCGVYARREAVFGNIDHARKVFDMALSSSEMVQPDCLSNTFLIYLWYAEVELANNSGSNSESGVRAMHILYSFGSGVKYIPFTCQPSSLQQLRARQGFRERIRTIRAMGAHVVTDDRFTALLCSAALFEELTAGWTAASEVYDQAFSMVLPKRRTHSYQFEMLFNYYVRMLRKHHQQSQLGTVWGKVIQGLHLYSLSPELYSVFVEIGHLHTTPSKMRWILDDSCQKKPSVIVWLYALSFEISRGSSYHRVHGLFERALASDNTRNSVILWRCYISYEMNVACDPAAARRVYFRAIHACPWSKKLWLDGFLKLNSILTAKELSDLQEVMRDKELNLRTDIYEILLQDEL